MFLNSLFYIICSISTPHAIEECALQKRENHLCSNHGGVKERDLTDFPELKCFDGTEYFSLSYCMIEDCENKPKDQL